MSEIFSRDSLIYPDSTADSFYFESPLPEHENERVEIIHFVSGKSGIGLYVGTSSRGNAAPTVAAMTAAAAAAAGTARLRDSIVAELQIEG